MSLGWQPSASSNYKAKLKNIAGRNRKAMRNTSRDPLTTLIKRLTVNHKPDIQKEWLETDGHGAFSSGTSSGVRSRRYHNLLMIAKNPPAERVILVNGMDVWVETPHGTFPISTQHYMNDVVWPKGYLRQTGFDDSLWPVWTFDVGESIEIKQELFVPHGLQGIAIRWQVSGPTTGMKLHVKPFLSGRDYHSMHHENADMHLTTENQSGDLRWQTYDDSVDVFAETNGTFDANPEWFRSFYYEVEDQRGLDALEDLGCPGELHFNLESEAEAILLLGAKCRLSSQLNSTGIAPKQVFQTVHDSESQRRSKVSRLDRSAQQYIVERNDGKTIIAGYPWFTDWGRDTFIAIRGLCFARDDVDAARDIVVAWADTVSEGMIPNRFPDHGEEPEFNSVDASLWYIVAIHEYWQLLERVGVEQDKDEKAKLQSAIEAILKGYSDGTRHRIGSDSDGLIAAGEDGVQLTWMDAKVDDWVVTPRIGKPVEIQCLWINALWIAAKFSKSWQPVLEKAEQSFREKFWNEEANCLFDVIDNDHQAGQADATIRPNQILAVGGLPYQLIDGDRAKSIVSTVEDKLLTPLGLRSLSPDDDRFEPIYIGDRLKRDGAYHQGTVWAWMLGPFVEAWLTVNGNSKKTLTEAKQRFLDPIEAHLNTAGLGHISEIADATDPFQPRGCPFQAWSLSEYIRVKKLVDGVSK